MSLSSKLIASGCKSGQRRTKPHTSEVGFGTGLNALLTLLHHQQQETKPILHYVRAWTLSPRERDRNTILFQGTLTEEEQELLAPMHVAPWDSATTISPHISIEKRHKDIRTASLEEATYDIITKILALEKALGYGARRFSWSSTTPLAPMPFYPPTVLRGSSAVRPSGWLQSPTVLQDRLNGKREILVAHH